MPVARRPSSKLAARTSRCGRYWSDGVTHGSDALDLEAKVFTLGSPRDIAASLKRSAERSRRRKASPYQSAMSMLTFYLNRAAKGLPERQRAVLERAKRDLGKRSDGLERLRRSSDAPAAAASAPPGCRAGNGCRAAI